MDRDCTPNNIKRIAIVLFRYFPYGGLSRDMLRIAREFQKRGFEVTIFCERWEYAYPKNIKVIILKPRGLTNHARSKNFAKEFNDLKESFNFILGFNRMPGLDAYYAADVCFAESVSKKPLIKRLCYLATPRCQTYLYLERKVFERNDIPRKVLFLDKSTKEKYTKHYDMKNIISHILPPGISTNLSTDTYKDFEKTNCRKKLSISSNEILFLEVGSDFKRKGVDRAIKAIAFLRQKLPVKQKFRLVIVGADDPSKYKKLARKLGIFSYILFTHEIRYASLTIASADVLLHPARTENTGTVIVEALALGVPVICTESCGFSHYVKEWSAGIVLPENKETDIQNNLNIACLQTITSNKRQIYKNGAYNFSKNRNKLDMPAEAVNWLEQYIK